MTLIYTQPQKQAIDHREGNLMIVACAGSGKTEVISRRIALLVNEGVPRTSIIAFTFTERAAREFKSRIRRHLEELRPDDPSLGDMYVGTIHSFCLQLLKEIDPGYRNFEVLDEAKQAALIASNYRISPDGTRGMGLDRLRSRTRRGGYWDSIRSFVSTLNVVHVKGINPQDITDLEVRDTITRYRDITTRRPNYFFDFNIIIDELICKLRDDPVSLERVRSRFNYLVVDEYQDVDPRQEELIWMLSDGGARMRVTVVGDDDQAIYGWRGASIENILSFEQRYPSVTKVELVDNFRSTHALVEMANAAINHIPAGRRLEKNMIARHWEMRDVGPVLAETMAEQGDVQRATFASEEEEAEWVADRIEMLRGVVITERDGQERAIDYADFAILLRSVRTCGQVFVDKLRQRDIPVVVKGTRALFSQDEVLLIQAGFCQLASSDFYYTDLGGSSHQLTVDAGREFIRLTIETLRQREAMPQADAAEFLQWIAAKRERLSRQDLPREQRGRLSRRIYPQAIFHEMLEVLGARSGAEPWPEVTLFNLGRLSNLLTQFEAVHQWITPRDLTALCIFLGGWAAGNTDEGAAEDATTPNAVQIMTVHGAKGLEWPVVFLPRISSANFPSSKRNQGPETFLDDNLFDPHDFASGDEGERRLWYVGLTRCRKFLHISSPDRPKKRPTEFFKEIRHDYVRNDGLDPTHRQHGTPTQPAETALLPTTFSDLSYYWSCPFDYQLRTLMGFGPGVRESYGYGQQLHNILAELHQRAARGEQMTADIARRLVEERFSLRYTTQGPLEALRHAAADAIARYVEEYTDHAHLVLHPEKPFEYMDRESGALISGTIDLLEKVESGPGGEERLVPVCVVDFKAQKWDTVEAYNERKTEVENQLRLYAAAVHHALGFDPRSAAAHFISPRQPPAEFVEQGVRERLEVDVSDGYQNQIRERVKSTVQSIRAQEFPRSGCLRGRCGKCDFRQICPGYTENLRRDPGSIPMSLEESNLSERQALMSENRIEPTSED